MQDKCHRPAQLQHCTPDLIINGASPGMILNPPPPTAFLHTSSALSNQQLALFLQGPELWSLWSHFCW